MHDAVGRRLFRAAAAGAADVGAGGRRADQAAQQVLVDRCMTAQGTAGRARPREGTLFGTDPAEPEVTLATGYTVRTHTDG
jgi:hypothetical protein